MLLSRLTESSNVSVAVMIVRQNIGHFEARKFLCSAAKFRTAIINTTHAAATKTFYNDLSEIARRDATELKVSQ